MKVEQHVMRECMPKFIASYMYNEIQRICYVILKTKMRVGCLKLQVIFCERTTNYKALLQKMTCKDMASYNSTPPCTWMRICTSKFIASHMDVEAHCISAYLMFEWSKCPQIPLKCVIYIFRESTRRCGRFLLQEMLKLAQPRYPGFFCLLPR